jgi:peptidoglycan/xylan/chitin deacetylase (PgdA/CDA1 family)
MKLAQLGAIATTMVIAVGLVMVVAPAYTHTIEHARLPPAMLSFSVVDTSNAQKWCPDLASVLEKHKVKATVFVTGWVADQHPECVTAFSGDVDIGSQTYSYANLTNMDYVQALEEVRKGKSAVNAAGGIDSRLFKAPYGSTDANTYSLLSRSGITADFSYGSQYNKYEDGQFVKYAIAHYEEPTYSPDAIRELFSAKKPVVISFDNSISIEQIDEFIAALAADSEIRLFNASELAGQELTAREVRA